MGPIKSNAAAKKIPTVKKRPVKKNIQKAIIWFR
jgi:hypothetical protein